jgi:CO dehydrogenase maturation factor
MKLAVTGKGGVGKTTLSAALATLCARAGARVVAVDADPDSNLASTLGFPDPEGITPLSEMEDLIAERTGAQPGASGSFFSLNPKVDDVPEAFCPEHDGVRLMSMGGGSREGGSGCLCPESSFLRALLTHLIFSRDDVVIMDMEAGVEHLTRGTAHGMDAMVVVVEPGKRSIETARRIQNMATDLKIKTLLGVANKVRTPRDKEFIVKELADIEVVSFLPQSDTVLDAGMGEHGGIAAVLDGPLGDEVRLLHQRLQQVVSATSD